MKKKISANHWQAIMQKLKNKGMSVDSAYDWMNEKFECDDTDEIQLHTTNYDADKEKNNDFVR